MTKQKNTKRALLLSALALVLCFSMFVGSTFAWFTDSVTSGRNKIVSGNLDVVLEYKTDWTDEWTTVDENTKLFDEGALYEPGYTEVVFLRVSNAGSLALKYSLKLDIIEEKASTNVYDNEFKLSDFLHFGAYIQDEYSSGFNYADVLMPVMFGEREAAVASVELAELSSSVSVIKSDMAILPGEQTAQIAALVLNMPETIGNEANHKTGVDAPEITFGLNLVATQHTHEEDSFGSDYDADATYPWDGTADTSWYNGTDTEFEIRTAEELAGFAAIANGGETFAGKKIELMADVSLSGKTWTPINSFAGEFDGNGNTISDFVIDATKSNAGFFNNIAAGSGERVHDLTISGVDATVGAYRFGTLANTIQGIVNRVTISDVDVTTTDDSAWVGGMCAFMSWPWLNDCTVENMVVDATAGAEFVAGFSPILQKNSNMVFDNCDVNGLTVTVADTDGSCGVGGFVGQTQRGWENPKMTNCDVTGINIVASGTVDVAGFMPWPGAHTIAENCTTQGVIDATGVTGADNFVGGFFGNLGWNADLGQMGHKITNCTADVDIISGGAPAGGFVGSATVSGNNSMYATFVNCTTKGDVTNLNGVAGGFAGVADRGDYDNCVATGTVNGAVAGGFIGQIKDVTPKYDHRYPAGTRDYLVDEIFIDNCTGSTGLALIGQIDAGTDVIVDGVQQ